MGFSGENKLFSEWQETTAPADDDYFLTGKSAIKKIKWSTIINLIKAKLGIADINKSISDLNSSLTIETGEKSVSTFLLQLLLYKDHKTVHFRCVGYTQQDMQSNIDYQFGTLPDGFWPIAGVLEYRAYSYGKDCRIEIPATDGRPIIRFFENVPAGTGLNINIMYVAK